MRIQVQFVAQRLPLQVPLNYNYHLTALIYCLLESSSHDYSSFLHDEGYRLGAKRFKLFTFSQLRFRRFTLVPPQIISSDPQVSWLISSPVEEFVQHLAQGLLSQGTVAIAGVPFGIERIETLAPPAFSERMRLACLSPLVAATGMVRAGKFMAHYYRHDEPGLAEAVRANLLKKYELLYGSAPPSSDLTLAFDRAYIARRREKIYKLIDFKGTKIKGIFAPFSVAGSPALIAVGYEAGFGEKNSMGFGMVKAI